MCLYSFITVKHNNPYQSKEYSQSIYTRPRVYWLTVHLTSVRIVVFDGNKRIELLLTQRNWYYKKN
jgi:hypothetical protein